MDKRHAALALMGWINRITRHKRRKPLSAHELEAVRRIEQEKRANRLWELAGPDSGSANSTCSCRGMFPLRCRLASCPSFPAHHLPDCAQFAPRTTPGHAEGEERR